MRFTGTIVFSLFPCMGLVAITAAQPVMLGDSQIKQIIAGNTLSDDAGWAEYYWPNGVIARQSYRGEWSVEEGIVCFDYTGNRYDGCYRMAVEGDAVHLYSEHGELQRIVSLIRGNPKNLMPAHADGDINKTFFDGVAIKGYDTVAYFTEGRPMKGAAEFAHQWLGATWHFANAEHRDLFVAQPQKYMPQFGGYCAAAMARGFVKSLDPEAWRIVDGKLYVYASKKGRDIDSQDMHSSIAKAEAYYQRRKAGMTP